MNTINVENCKTLLIGRRGENEVTTVAFDFSEWATEFGSGVVDLYVKRFGDESAYPVLLTIDGTVASWLVTETDTNVAGYGKAEYVYRVDGKIAKSAVFPFFVAEDIGQPASEPPDPYESWLEQLTALGAETEAHAQAAEQSAEDAAQSAQEAEESAASVEGAVEQAEAARDAAQAAQAASESARDAAQTAQASAESSATAASGSAASAAGSATAAAGSASDASASATAAGASATAASASATTASNAATAAQTAQSAAEDAAEDAQQAAQQAHVEYEQLTGEVDDLSDEVAQQKSAIEDLQDLTNRKAGMLVDSASGAIASFVPDATIPDLLDVSVAVEPVQDLHGYDAPWPAGGGKNILDDAYSSSYTNELTLTEGTYYAQAWLTQSPSQHTTNPQILIDGVWTGCAPPYSGDGITISGTSFGWLWSNATQTIVVDAGKICTIRYARNDAAMQTRRLTFSKTQLSAFAPYSNICPISGWDAVEVERTGVNLFDKTLMADASTGAKYITLNLAPNTAYTMSTDDPCKSGGTITDLFFCNMDEAVSSGTNGVKLGKTVTRTSDADGHLRIGYRCYEGWITPEQLIAFNTQVEVGTTASNYVPFSMPTTYTIQLGQTVYGGTLDATAGTLTVDMAAVDLGTLNWSYVNSIFVANLPSDSYKYANTVKALSDCYAFVGTIQNGTYDMQDKADCSFALYYNANYPSSRVVYVKNTAYTDAATFKTAMDGRQIVYQLATPITITLDPVTISTIAGQPNNVWADAGDVSVEYAADVKTYIDQKIAAAVAALS